MEPPQRQLSSTFREIRSQIIKGIETNDHSEISLCARSSATMRRPLPWSNRIQRRLLQTKRLILVRILLPPLLTRKRITSAWQVNKLAKHLNFKYLMGK